MKNINYKYVSLALFFLLVLTFGWHWKSILKDHGYDRYRGSKVEMMDEMEKIMNEKMHKMPNGEMMMNNDEYMKMDSEDGMTSMTMEQMVEDLNGKKGKDLEKAFIMGMIPHHQGAVEMSKKLLEDQTISDEVKKFANQIITAQEGEIKMMNEWLKKY